MEVRFATDKLALADRGRMTWGPVGLSDYLTGYGTIVIITMYSSVAYSGRRVAADQGSSRLSACICAVVALVMGSGTGSKKQLYGLDDISFVVPLAMRWRYFDS